jgi:NTE family protein
MILAASTSAQEQPTMATPAQPPESTQEQPAKSKRPTVGLVLQGGGALGLAHIGVITWLEEHRIPVNYIAGTSMGGLVGGVYATGRTAAEVRAVVNGINWDQVMSGQAGCHRLSQQP